MTLDNELKPLQEINGYLASAIFDMTGKVLAIHNNSKYTIEISGANIVAMINAGINVANAGNLGELCFVQVNSELGMFCAVWGADSQSIAVVLLEPKGNVGLAKLALTKLGEKMLA